MQTDLGELDGAAPFETEKPTLTLWQRICSWPWFRRTFFMDETPEERHERDKFDQNW